MFSQSWFGCLSVVCLALGLSSSGRLAANQAAPEPPDGDRTAQPLPTDVVSAWEKAGASVGWFGPASTGRFGPDRRNGYWQFNTQREELDVARSVPTFKIHAWREGMLAKLPAPARAFGLDLSETHVTDAGLKELAGLKQLTTLDLFGTQVTDAGLKELAGLMQLTTLYLSETQVTDAGLKELAGLKQLTTLDLSYTRVTATGTAELGKALPHCKIIRF